MQTLHVGSYDDEAPVLNAMHNEFIPAQSLQMTGKHHEVYLSDARRTPADKLKTILRQPVSQLADRDAVSATAFHDVRVLASAAISRSKLRST